MPEQQHISTIPVENQHHMPSRVGDPEPDGLCHCPAGPLDTTPIGMCRACYRLVID